MSDTIVSSYHGSFKLKLDPRFFLEREILSKGKWEEHVLELIKYFIKPGFTCVDVGANVGLLTIAMAAQAGDGGRVYAFEPNSLTFPRLVDNINLNPVLRPRVVAEKLGIGNEQGFLHLYQVAGGDGNAYMGKEMNPKLWNGEDAENFELCLITTLDDYFGEERDVHFLKMDVEGMELEVMLGGRKLIERCRPLLLYETLIDEFDREKIEAATNFVIDLGYRNFCLPPGLKKLMPVAFPALHADTLAIPEKDLIRHAEVIFNAVQLTFEACQEAAWPQFKITLICCDKGVFFAGVSEADQKTVETLACRLEGEVLYFCAPWRNQNVEFSLELLTRNSSDVAVCREEVHGSAAAGGRTYRISGRRTGGAMFDYLRSIGESSVAGEQAARVSS